MLVPWIRDAIRVQLCVWRLTAKLVTPHESTPTHTRRFTGVEYNARARLLMYRSPAAEQLPKTERLPGTVAVVSGGAADQPVVSVPPHLPVTVSM